MKVFFNSIVLKTLFLLLLSSSIFIGIVFFSANYFFSHGYISIVREGIRSIESNINPIISLNLSYDLTDSINEVAQKQLENKKILFIKIESPKLKEPLIFSNTDKSLQVLKKENHFFSHSSLIDPATSIKLGEMTLVYSNSAYKKFMDKFYGWLIFGVFIFIVSILIVGFSLYSTLKNLRSLALFLEKFDPQNPQKIPFDIKTKDEVGVIARSANILLENLKTYLDSIHSLHETVSEKEAHLKQAQRIANIGSWEYNVKTKRLQLSDEIYRILKLDSKTKITWERFLSFIIDKDYDKVNLILQKAIENGTSFDLSYKIKIDNGSIIDIKTKGRVNKKANGDIKLIATTMDVTQENKTKQTIERLAFYDPLTSLPNRVLLKNRIHKTLQTAQVENKKFALMFLDLDHFKLINDTLGHDTGDRLLVYIANLLKAQLRESDTVARIGGDEFVILIPSFDSIEDLRNIAEKCLEALRGKHIVDKHHLYITTSIGIAIYPENGTDIDSLMTNADIAMYDAKNDGKNNYKFFSKSMTNFISKELEIEQDLRIAIQKKNELEIYYQPKIKASTGDILGAEALIRWNHPKKGLIFPDEFIDVAENTGLIIEIGDWIIEKCISDLAEFHNSIKAGLKIAINLSAKQFQDEKLIEQISLMIKKYNVNPQQLEFEITESLSMANIDVTLRVLSRLKSIGVSIVIDDFGTGYSSLAYLKKFPIDILKIDKTFVMDMVEDDEDKMIVKTVITMAHSLGFETVAEGVETKEHVEALKRLECDQLQGYFYSRPVKKEIFIEYLKSYNN